MPDYNAHQGEIIQLPSGTKMVVVNHWDWPFAWIMSFVFIIATAFILWAGRRK